MKVAIIGPGAMGCLFASLLIRAKHEVWLIDKNSERAQKIKQAGIKVEGLGGVGRVKVKTTTNPADITPIELLIFCVKSYDTESAAKAVAAYVSDNTAVLTLQNGAGNIEILSKIFGAERVIGGVTSQGATLLGPGHIRHAGRGETIIGRIDGKGTAVLKEVRDTFMRAGIVTKISKNISSIIWSKLIINVGINALTALTRLNNGRLIEYNWTKEVLRLAVLEAVKVAKRKRIKLVYDDPIQKVESVCAATAGNVSSMLQDVLKCRRTEIDYINGVIVRQGQSFSIPTPVNLVLYNIVRTIEDSYRMKVMSQVS
ncbi:MAG: 2-dehydropantoate 2-reductase [Candidatus Omnitrophota bacterium]